MTISMQDDCDMLRYKLVVENEDNRLTVLFETRLRARNSICLMLSNKKTRSSKLYTCRRNYDDNMNIYCDPYNVYKLLTFVNNELTQSKISHEQQVQVVLQKFLPYFKQFIIERVGV